MSSPYSEPGAFLSARKRSPETQEKVYESENELVKIKYLFLYYGGYSNATVHTC